MAVVSSRNFSQNIGAAKKQAAHGPVIITDRGKPERDAMIEVDPVSLSLIHIRSHPFSR
jgi:hypothetical protein